MKMMYNGLPVNSAKVNNFEVSTNDATLIPSDLQTGVSAYARGQKVIGTGKSFEFAYYGGIISNDSIIVPIDTINVAHISSIDYPIHSVIQLSDMKNLNFDTNQIICNLIENGLQHPVSVRIQNNEVFVNCDIDANFEIFFGKDNYV